jgi:WD40 repeat protein
MWMTRLKFVAVVSVVLATLVFSGGLLGYQLLTSAAPLPDDANPRTDRPIKPMLLHTLNPKARGRLPVAFAPDGKLLATGSGPSLRLWDPVAGREVRVLDTPLGKAGRGWVNSLAFSPDGQTLAAAGQSKTIVLWDPSKGEIRRQLEAADSIESVAFSPDGKLLLAGGPAGVLQLWDVAAGKIVRPFDEHKGLRSLAMAPDGKWAASCGDGLTVRLWEVSTGKMVQELYCGEPVKPRVGPIIGGPPTPVARIHSAVFSPDSATLATANNDGSLWLWEVASGKKLREITGRTGTFLGICAVAFTPDGKVLATADGQRKTVRLWETSTGKELAEVAGDAEIGSVALSSKGGLLAASSNDPSGAGSPAVRVWRLTGGN